MGAKKCLGNLNRLLSAFAVAASQPRTALIQVAEIHAPLLS
jgi:hypothetical protein